MSKHYIRKMAICPYYKHEDSQMVYCYYDDQLTIHLAFPERASAKAFKQMFCCKKFYNCKIYKMLEEKGDE